MGFAPGGSTDTTARVVAQGITAGLGRPVVVENRTGAAGNVATEHVARSAPDGHTLVVASMGSHATNAALYRDLPFDVARDFAPVSLVALSACLLVVHPSVPVRSVSELVARAEADPGGPRAETPRRRSPPQAPLCRVPPDPRAPRRCRAPLTGARRCRSAARSKLVAHSAGVRAGRRLGPVRAPMGGAGACRKTGASEAIGGAKEYAADCTAEPTASSMGGHGPGPRAAAPLEDMSRHPGANGRAKNQSSHNGGNGR